MIVHLDYIKDLISRKDKIKELGIGPGVLEIRNSVNGNRTELTADDIDLLTITLRSNSVLNTLKLADCILNDLNGKLIKLIAECEITTIVFNSLDLTHSILREIAEGLKLNSSLRSITFDNVNLQAGDGLDILIEGLEKNTSLNKLMFRRNNLPTNEIDQLIDTADSQVPLKWTNFYIVNNNPELNQSQQEIIANINNRSMGFPAHHRRLKH